jgi:hypothetical protein
MENERQPLVKSLLDTITFYKTQRRVGRMKTEHSIFIPSELVVNSTKETEDFIKAAKQIKKHTEWNCPVSLEPHQTARISGLEFVFEFSTETQFDTIIEFLRNY